MAKFRVYEIAKKYNKDNKEILEILKANHVEVKNHMSTIGDEQIKMIENALKPKKEAKQDHNSKKQENSKRKDNKKAQNMEKKNKMKEFSILNKVGYVYSDLKKMLLKENILYFICVLVIPLPYLIFMAREFILMNSTMLFFYSGLFIYYVVTLLICLLLNYHAGKIQLLKGE